eukprot:symbB.v1.2.038243.t1/scaffold5892.1/size22708/2
MIATQSVSVVERFEKWGLHTIRSQLPRETKHLRACMKCRLIMSKGQFFELGCPNCRDLEMQENENRVFACTTSNYSGFFSMVNPGACWKWVPERSQLAGCYALVVHGKLPDFELGDDDYEPDIDEGEGEQEQAQGG